VGRRLLNGFISGIVRQPFSDHVYRRKTSCCHHVHGYGRLHGPLPSTKVAGALAVLGEKEKALEWLEKAHDERSGFIVTVKCEFVFENLRNEPRFQALLNKMGLA
jgi:hypothetical protein